MTIFAVVLVGFAALESDAATPTATQKTFDAPQQAAEALVAAAEKDDVETLFQIFGKDGKDIVSSGDAVEDKNVRKSFVEKARQKMRVTQDPHNPKRMLLLIGADDWPMPVPIVRKQGKWLFDAKQGREEILARRIGGNELDAIALLRGYVEAQKEYASQEHDGSGIHQYAQKAISTQGKHDGLSWRNADGSVGGPIGDLVAKALAAGYTSRTEPYNGYYFRTLTAQGPAAPLGARDYIVNGMMIGGFAALAWPAHYGVTGIQTFMVSHDGIVYQRDLGPDTAKIAPTIKRYNPDKSWIVTEDEP
ncbi:MAG: DUF2950 domain-containing protein [Acidithiobacillales bacterium]